MTFRLLIAGTSTRAAADSAARSGFDVTAIDAFGDLDQHPAVRSLSMARDFDTRATAREMARAARSIDCDAVAYLSSFENHPRAVATLAAGRTLLGNSPEVLERVRDPLALAEALRTRGFSVPEVRRADLSRRSLAKAEAVVRRRRPDASHDDAGSGFPGPPKPLCGEGGSRPESWLLKPLASGGGQRVRLWRPTQRIPARSYLQEFIDGTPGSIAFVSAGGRCVPLGISRQLVGEAAFGASRYRYCGSLLEAPGPAAPERLAAAVTEAFGLTGLNGIDFMVRDGVPYPLEVNPRWSSSMELVERAYGTPLFALHVAACLSGILPPVSLGWGRPAAGTFGKAIVFARHDVVIGDTRAWLDDVTVRDVPHPGERIAADRPVCTLFAEGGNYAECHAALVRRADVVYAQLAGWAGRAA